MFPARYGVGCVARIWFIVKTASVEVSGTPSFQRTPLRSLIVTRVNVLSYLKPVASHGSSFPVSGLL